MKTLFTYQQFFMKTFTFYLSFVLAFMSVSCLGIVKASDSKQTFWTQDFNDVYELPAGWQNIDHNSSGIEWYFNGMRAETYNYFEEDSEPRTHASLITSAINCSDKSGIVLSVRHALYYEDEYDSYYAKILVSTDGNLWTTVQEYTGFHDFENVGNWSLPLFEFDISHVADNQSEVFIRFEFKGNDDNLDWLIQDLCLKTGGLSPAALVSPSNGALYQPLNVNLVWQKGPGSDPDGYKLYFGLENPPQEMVYDGENTQFSVSGLQYETTYFWKVVPYLDDESAEDIPVWSFTTQPENAFISQLPYTENFDNFPAPEMPFGWSTFVSASCPFAQVMVHTRYTDPEGNHPWSAPNHVRFSNSGHPEAVLMVYTPPVTVDMSSMRVRFYARTYVNPLFGAPSNNQIQVGVITDIANPNSFIPIGTVSLSFDFDQYMVSFEDYTGDANIIVFRAVMEECCQFTYLDEIVFEQIPTEPIQVNIPSSINFGNLESNYDSSTRTVSIRNWGGGSLTIDPEDIYLSGDEVDAFTLHNINSTLNLQGFESFVLTLDFAPLTPGNKNVILYVGDMQIPVSANSVNPDIVSFPYFQNFDEVIAPKLPIGWRNYVESTDPDAEVKTHFFGSFNTPSPPNFLLKRNYFDKDAVLFSTTPLIIPGEGVEELWVRFKAYSIQKLDYLVVGVMSDREDISSFQAMEKVYIYPDSYFFEYAVRIPVTAEHFYIAFTTDLFVDNREILLDDVIINVAPELYPVSISVKEASSEGTPLHGVELNILGHSPITTRQVFSAVNGQVSLQLEAGIHTIFANLPGYQQREIVFDVTSKGATVVVDMSHIVYPPFNLTAEAKKPGETTLSWNDPGEVHEFRYDSGTPAGHLGIHCNIMKITHVLGSAFHYFAELHEISWFLTGDGEPHDTIMIWVTGLDQYGYPDADNLLFWDQMVSNVDNQWNVYQLPEPILTPNGFFIGLSCDGFLPLAIDDGMTHPYQFVPNRHFALGYILQPGTIGVPIEDAGFLVNLLLRANGYMINSIEFEENPWKFNENLVEVPELVLKRTASGKLGQPASNVKSPVLAPWANSHIYLDDMDQPFASWVNQSVFTFNQLAAGNYTAGVRTVSSTVESEIVDISFVVQEATNVETPGISMLKIFPNPADNVLNIVSGEIITQIAIFDITGRKVYSSEPNDNNLVISTGNLNKGMYLMQIITSNDIITKRVKIVR
jgi:hypothetical protein